MASTTSPPAVKLSGINKRFGKVEAVRKTDLDIEDGALVTLLGPSGCGKTTILRMVAGLETPTQGDIFIKGKRVNDIPIHKRNLGMIFQNYALFPHKSIFDNVAFGLKYRNVPKEEIASKVARALEVVRLPGVEKRFPSQLSGGQQQRIALARAIVIEPDVLLMDEPLSALDENLREDMRREIDNLQQMLGVTTIFVTHDQREALSMSDKIVVMQAGKVLQQGPPEEVYNSPVNHFVADFLGSSNFFPVEVLGTEGELTRVRLETGEEMLVRHPGDWKKGMKAELVVRAQKFAIHTEDDADQITEQNVFKGKIIDRSYMGGEVSYFIRLESGLEIHSITQVQLQALKIGMDVLIEVAPRRCGLLPPEEGNQVPRMQGVDVHALFNHRFPHHWTTVDSHTQGESTRLLLHGAGDIPGHTMGRKREYFQANLDQVRKLLTREPRGHRDMLAAAVTAPVTPGADFGLVYMDARRYPFLCGHATIGAVTTMVELGLIPPQENIIVDTPSGPMRTRVEMDGDKVATVALRSVPTFVYGHDKPLQVPGLGTLTASTVCVGGYFVMVDGDKAGLDLSPGNRAALIPLGMRIIEEANRQLTVRHPERPEVSTIDVVEIFSESDPAHGKSVVVYGESHMDRCPCGTGTTAKAALLNHKGLLSPGETYTNTGPLGTAFTAEIVEETRVGELPAVCVEVRGGATLTGCHSFALDPADPFAEGFLL